jgi:hypothetical protein
MANSWMRRARQNILWIGGWEVGQGWRPHYPWGGLASPWPLTFCRFLTIYGWGLDCRLPWTILVWTWRGERGIYLSRDGTPGNATWWLRKPRWRA